MTSRKTPNKHYCLFRRTYIRKDKTYTVSFKGLTKQQADIINHIFCTLDTCGIVYTYLGGFTLPELELRCSIPLERGFGSSLIVPNSTLSALVHLFNNSNFSKKDILTSSNGVPLSHINKY